MQQTRKEPGSDSSNVQIGDHALDVIVRKFDTIYRENAWGGGSGRGSTYNNNIDYVAFVARFIQRNNIRSVVDLGCGDWQFSRYMNWEGISYLGVDVVPSLVQRNNEIFGSETIKFILLPELFALPQAHLLLCKDVMQHWPNSMVADALGKISGKYQYILLTNDEEPSYGQNPDISLGQCRPLDVRKAPFNRRAATVFSWHVPPVQKSTMLLLGEP